MPLAANDKKILYSVTPLLCQRVHPNDILFLLAEVITTEVARNDIEKTADSKSKEVGMFHLLRHYEANATNLLALQAALEHILVPVDIYKLVEEKRESEKEFDETIKKIPITHDAIIRSVDETKKIASQREVMDALNAQFNSINTLVELMGCKIMVPNQPIAEEMEGAESKSWFRRLPFSKRSKKRKIPANTEHAGLERRPSMVSIASETSSTSGYYGGSFSSMTSIAEETAITTIKVNCEAVKNNTIELRKQFELLLNMLEMKRLEQRLQDEQRRFELAELGEKFERDLATELQVIMDDSAARFSELKEKLPQDIKEQIEAMETAVLNDNAKLKTELIQKMSEGIEQALQQVQTWAHADPQIYPKSEGDANGSAVVNLQPIIPTATVAEEFLSHKTDVGIRTLQNEWTVVQSAPRMVSDEVTEEHDSVVESVLENLAKGQETLLERTEKMSELLPDILTQIHVHKVQRPEQLERCSEQNLIDNMKKFEESAASLSEQIRDMEQEEGPIKIAFQQLCRMISDEIKSGLAATGEKNTLSEITECQKSILERVERLPEFVMSKLQEMEAKEAEMTKNREEGLVDVVRRVMELNQSQWMVQLSEQISSVVDKIKEALSLQPDDHIKNYILDAMAEGQRKVLIDTQSLISGGIKTELESHKMVQESLEKLASLIPQEGRTIRAQLGDERGTLLQEMQANEQRRANDVQKLTDSMEACKPPPFPIAQLSRTTSELVIEANERAIDSWVGRTNQNLEQLTAKVTQMSGGDAPITNNLKELTAKVTEVLSENKNLKLSFFDPTKRSMTLGFSHEFSVRDFDSYDTDKHYESSVASITHGDVTRKFKLCVTPKDSRDGCSDFLGVYLRYEDGPEEKLKLNYELISLTEDGQKSIIKIDNKELVKSGENPASVLEEPIPESVHDACRDRFARLVIDDLLNRVEMAENEPVASPPESESHFVPPDASTQRDTQGSSSAVEQADLDTTPGEAPSKALDLHHRVLHYTNKQERGDLYDREMGYIRVLMSNGADYGRGQEAEIGGTHPFSMAAKVKVMVPLPHEAEQPLRGFLASEALFVDEIKQYCYKLSLTNVGVAWQPFYKHLYVPQSRMLILPSNPRALSDKYRKNKAMHKAGWIKMGKDNNWKLQQPGDLKKGHVFMSNKETFKVLWQLKDLHATLAQRCHNNETGTPIGGVCDYGVFFHELDFDEVGKQTEDPARAMIMSNNRMEQITKTREQEKKALERDHQILTSGPNLALPSRFKTSASMSKPAKPSPKHRSPKKVDSPVKRTVSTRSKGADPPPEPVVRPESVSTESEDPRKTPDPFAPDPNNPDRDPMAVLQALGLDQGTLAAALLSVLGKGIGTIPQPDSPGPSTAPDTSEMLNKVLEQQKQLMQEFEDRHRQEMKETKEAVENVAKQKQISDLKVVELTNKLKIQEDRLKAERLLLGQDVTVAREVLPKDDIQTTEGVETEKGIEQKEEEPNPNAPQLVHVIHPPPRNKKTTSGSFYMQPEGGPYYYSQNKIRRVHHQYLLLTNDQLSGKCYECYRPEIQFEVKGEWLNASQINEQRDEDTLLNVGKGLSVAGPDFKAKQTRIDDVIETVREKLHVDLTQAADTTPTEPPAEPELAKTGSGRRKKFKEITWFTAPATMSAQEGLDHYRFIRGQLQDLIAEIQLVPKITPNTAVVLAKTQKSLLEITMKINKRKNAMKAKGIEIERETEDEDEDEEEDDWDKDDDFLSSEQKQEEDRLAREKEKLAQAQQAEKLKKKLEKQRQRKEEQLRKKEEEQNRRKEEKLEAQRKEAETRQKQKELLDQLMLINPTLAAQLNAPPVEPSPKRIKVEEPEEVFVSDSDDDEKSEFNESPPLEAVDDDLSLFIPNNIYPNRAERDPLVVQNRWKQFLKNPKMSFRFPFSAMVLPQKESSSLDKEAQFRAAFYWTLKSLIKQRGKSDYSSGSLQSTLTTHQNKLATLKEDQKGGMRGIYKYFIADTWFRDILLQTAMFVNLPDSYNFSSQCKLAVTRANNNYAVAFSRKKKSVGGKKD